MTPQEALDRAADVLEKRGWLPKPGFIGSGPVCVLQAIWIAHGYDPSGKGWSEGWSQSVKAATDLALSRIEPPEKLIHRWNDRQKSVKPVLAALRGTS